MTAGTILQLAAATQSGGGGLCLFAIGRTTSIWSTHQATPGGAWTPWDGPKFAGQPAPASKIAAAGQNDGRLMLVMLDTQGMTWTLGQDSPSGGWGGWQGPCVGGEKFSYSDVAAGQQGGDGGIRICTADPMGKIWELYQTTPGGAWSNWEGPGLSNQPASAGEVALASQNDGNLMLFAEGGGKVMAVAQLSPGGDWGEWQQLSAPLPLVSLCAAQQGGDRGVQLWAIDQTSGQIWTILQEGAGGNWSDWKGPGFHRQPESFQRLAAADQGDGCCLLLATGMDGEIWATGQASPGGDWGDWHRIPAPGTVPAEEAAEPAQPA